MFLSCEKFFCLVKISAQAEKAPMRVVEPQVLNGEDAKGLFIFVNMVSIDQW